MRITAIRVLGLTLVFTVFLQVNPAFGSSNYKCKTPACDISAIGHRNLFKGRGVGNWYSTEKEKELGKKYAAIVEQRVDILKDTAINDYVDRVAQRVAHNSDVEIPITVRIIRRNDASAFTVVGGHLYLTTGLLLKLHSEGELASVLARGIAHTATHTVARLLSRASLLQAASIPMFGIDSLPPASGPNDFMPMFGLLKFQRDFELEADYFGIQYVYTSGCDADCFLSAVQSLWQRDPGKTVATAFDTFPPLGERLKMLRQEIDDILPKVPLATVSTPEFDEFIGKLRQLPPADSAPAEDARPKLVRHDSSRE